MGNEIRQDEHVFIAGMTGCGKSFLAENYLAGFPFVVMLDTKGETLKRIKENKRAGLPDYFNIWAGVAEDDLTICQSLDELPHAKTGKIIYIPALDEMNQASYELFFRWIYLRENCTVWVDEGMEISPNPAVLPHWAKAILTRGRSRNTSMWCLTQRPSGISQLFMSQSTHLFEFTLPLLADRDKIVKITSCPEMMEKPKKHEFWYFKDGWEHAKLGKFVVD